MNNTSTDMIADIQRGLREGWLRILVDDRITSRMAPISPFVDEGNTARDATLRWVHVISDHAGGEIRGYALIDGKLPERGPYFMEWPELDEAVSTHLGIPLYTRH